MIFARKLVAAATIALVALSGSAQALSPQEEHFEVLASQLANATAVSIDLEPLLEGE